MVSEHHGGSLLVQKAVPLQTQSFNLSKITPTFSVTWRQTYFSGRISTGCKQVHEALGAPELLCSRSLATGDVLVCNENLPPPGTVPYRSSAGEGYETPVAVTIAFHFLR